MRTLDPVQKVENQRWIKHFVDKYGFVFYDPAFEQVPNVSEVIDNPRARELVIGLEYYLLGSYPIDMKTNDHKEIRKIRHLFSKEEYEWHQKHNKLGINCWGTKAGLVLMRLNQIFKREDLTVGHFPDTNEYSAMPFNQKVAVCAALDMKLYSILEKIHSEHK